MNTASALTVSVLGISGIFLLHNLTQPNTLNKSNGLSFLPMTSVEQLVKQHDKVRLTLETAKNRTMTSKNKAASFDLTQSAFTHKDTPPTSPTKNDNVHTESRTLWSFKSSSETGDRGIPVYRLQTNTSYLDDLQPQQTFSITLPEINTFVEATLTSHYQATANVDIFEGPITNFGTTDHLIISKGKIETHIIVSTEKGVFTGRIDNSTGETTLVNESHANPELGSDADFINAPVEDSSEIPIPKGQSLSAESTL
jgi:hypothetical protein